MPYHVGFYLSGSFLFSHNIRKWPHRTPQVIFLLIYIISLALGLAVGAMLSWHLYLISKGQTTVENHDFATYRKLAKNRGEVGTTSVCQRTDSPF